MTEKAWGTPVMMLGRTPRTAAKLSAAGPAGLGATQSSAPAVDWAFLLGSYAGAWGGGAGIGYVVGRKPQAALTGGMAASGAWAIGETIAYARARQPLMSVIFGTLATGSLALAWTRR